MNSAGPWNGGSFDKSLSVRTHADSEGEELIARKCGGCVGYRQEGVIDTVA